MRSRLRRLVLGATALFTAASALPAAAATTEQRAEQHPSRNGMSAVIRYTEYGTPSTGTRASPG
ncbi:hypothetical protein [Streptomyces sp. AK010]|uniref:hypothetical protein n=1 Tax=Streptomyces sp. AK010 TaxID=2723074 RepID=UPI0016108815|nr:hypothetical protein [Streptomyces sp. AK010]MBB6420342.1 nitrous oxide reductase [Streptomyces sp. AK010]